MIRFGDGSAIGQWSAAVADAGDLAGLDLIGRGGRDSELPPLDSVELEPLPAGCWVLTARLFRADGRGNGVTYWSISVSP